MDRAPEALLTLAQIALGFAGFTSIIVTFKRDPGAPWSAIDAFRTARMLSASLAALFFALVPEALLAIGLSSETTWRIGSALVFVYFFASGRSISKGLRDLPPSERIYLDRGLAVAVGVIVLLNTLLQVANASGLWWSPDYWAYYLGILGLLAMSSFQFVRIVFVRPNER
jgi:hypothetical protein